ncbi:hypothetical protein KY495_02060 [Massilia sp. PAMC28688]|uniref:hypothetical protein n=1 Tax=Massilia sp. PAMC28688 TaxID=2861283 RepID=UPI001C634059|nr:hypothetical protein [Massilia sp. PAMC28688]QYF94044.1 hypothetical protein KY495_02060 [Massilia sp. PAMC28688]
MMNQTSTFTFAAVPRAARAALQWRLLLLWVLLMLIPTAILAMPLWTVMSTGLDHSVHAAAFARQLDMTVFADLMAMHGKHAEAFNLATMLALATTLLLSPLLTGMAATASRAPATPGMRDLIAGGLREYPRMLRMLVWSVVPLGLAVAIGGAAMDAAGEQLDKAIVASDVDLINYAAIAVAVLLFAFAHATLDAGRAALTIERRRTSAVKAWWSGLKMVVRRPVASLGVYFAISIVGLAIAAALTVARINVAGWNLGLFIAALLLVQLTVAVLAWMRSARLFAMVELARSQKV